MPRDPAVPRRRSEAFGHVLALWGVVVVTALFVPFRVHANTTTIGFAYLLVVLSVATWRGMRPAVTASIAGMVGFNFFFLPPYGTLTISDPQNWVALFAFVATAITAGRLSATARRRAAEAEMRRLEVERLYDELRDAFDRASRAEALRQSEELKSALLDAVTHDLRTPLTAIKASVTTLLDEYAPIGGDDHVALESDARQELLDVIDEESDRLDRYVGNLVELARLEAGAMPLRRRWTAPEELMRRVVERMTGGRGARVAVEVEPDAPSMYVDGRALTEALYVVVDNALKYSPAGATVTVYVAATPDGRTAFVVDDEGPGVPPELRERVFERFFRGARAAGATAVAGLGMGLAIARRIVEAHGGSIGVLDGPSGRGARVTLVVPVGEPDDDPEESAR